jgi:hypothetical protein
MSIEAGILKNEEEKKRKKLSQKEKKEVFEKQIKLKQTKEKIEKQEKTEKELFKLKNLLENNNLDHKTKELIKKVCSSNDISENGIKEIFEKIEEIDKLENVSQYLPKDLRITKEEYQKSLTDDITRTKTLTKLNTSLVILSENINPDSSFGLNLFSGFITVLDKNLIKIQENHIDIRNSLQKIENKKNKVQKLSLWQKIIIFFKKLIK